MYLISLYSSIHLLISEEEKSLFDDSILLVITEADAILLELMQYFFVCGNIEFNGCLGKRTCRCLRATVPIILVHPSDE